MKTEFNLKKTLSEIRSLEAMGMTQAQVAEKLNLQGFKTRSGNEWSRARIATLKNRNVSRNKSAKIAPKVAKAFGMKTPEGGGVDDLAVIALKRTDWSDKKKLKVVAAILGN